MRLGTGLEPMVRGKALDAKPENYSEPLHQPVALALAHLEVVLSTNLRSSNLCRQHLLSALCDISFHVCWHVEFGPELFPDEVLVVLQLS